MATTIALTSCEKEVTPNGIAKNLSNDAVIAMESSAEARTSDPFDEYVGDEITSTEFTDMTERFQDNNPNWPAYVDISNSILNTMMSDEECIGVIMYYAKTSENVGYHVFCPIVDTAISLDNMYKSTSSGMVATTEANVIDDVQRFQDDHSEWWDGHLIGKVSIDSLGDQSTAVGVRFYNAQHESTESAIAAVGYDINDDDVAGMYYDRYGEYKNWVNKQKKNIPGGINTTGTTGTSGIGGIGGVLTGTIPQ